MKAKTAFLAGIILGGLLTAAGTAYAAGVLAVESPQAVFLDGKPVSVTGYNIEGRNYYALRDLAALTGVTVEYDAAKNGVQIYSEKPDREETTEKREERMQKEEPRYADVSVQYGSDGRPLLYEAKPGSVLYGTGNVSKAVNPYAASEYDGYMPIKEYSRGVPFPTEPLKAINPRWDNSYYEIEMPNPMPCYTHILAGESSSFLGIEVEGASEQYDMYVFNAHETQRIIDELYDTFLENPACYTNGRLNCTVRVGLTASGLEGNYFYPYRENCVEQTVGDRNVEYMVYAVDTYTNSVFMGTKYCCIPNCSPDNPDVISSDTTILKDRQYR